MEGGGYSEGSAQCAKEPQGGPSGPTLRDHCELRGPLILAPQTPEMQASAEDLFRFPCIRFDPKIAKGALCFAGRAPG